MVLPSSCQATLVVPVGTEAVKATAPAMRAPLERPVICGVGVVAGGGFPVGSPLPASAPGSVGGGLVTGGVEPELCCEASDEAVEPPQATARAVNKQASPREANGWRVWRICK